MKKSTPEMRLERILEKLSREIALASDEEVLEACADLRIQPEMKGTVAFLGVKGFVFPYRQWTLPESDDPSALADPDDPPDLLPRQ
jgi:hypothetical protein